MLVPPPPVVFSREGQRHAKVSRVSDQPDHPAESAGRPADTGPDPTFDVLYQRYSREVWAAVYARCLDADLAMDVTQESFLRLWRHQEARGNAGDGIVNARAWLFRVARNLAEDAAKSAFRRNGTQPDEVMTGVRSAGRSPLDAMARDELFAQVRGVLNELGPQDRELLTLRYALDYDSPRIAEALGVNVSAVHMRLSRARQRLAERLAVHGIEGPP